MDDNKFSDCDVYTINISIGGVVSLAIESMRKLQDAPTDDRFSVLAGNGNYKYSGTLNLKNLNQSVPTTYSWSKIGGSTGTPSVNRHASGKSVMVESKGPIGYVKLQCVVACLHR